MHHGDDQEFGTGFGGFFRMRGGQRLGRGDMSPIILRVLQKKPMHGYEIIRTLEERSHGFWRPSAGSVYPTLQMLEEQELVVATEHDGKKVYELTEKGQTEAKKAHGFQNQPHHPHTGFWSDHKNPEGIKMLWSSFHTFVKALKEVTFSQREGTIEEAQKIMTEATEKLNKLIQEEK